MTGMPRHEKSGTVTTQIYRKCGLIYDFLFGGASWPPPEANRVKDSIIEKNEEDNKVTMVTINPISLGGGASWPPQVENRRSNHFFDRVEW